MFPWHRNSRDAFFNPVELNGLSFALPSTLYLVPNRVDLPCYVAESQTRYLVQNYENGALLRIEPVRSNRDTTYYECLAENGVGDAVSAETQLKVFEGEF